MTSVENMLEPRTSVEFSALLVHPLWPQSVRLYCSALLAQPPWPLQLYNSVRLAQPPWPPSVGREGGLVLYKDDKMIRSYKCGLEPFDKITDLDENIAMKNV